MAATIAIAAGCGGKSNAVAPDGGGVMDADVDHGADTGGGSDVHPGNDGAPACVPTLPALAWTSPYAGWSRGVPTDPAFFPIGVWLQGSWHATEMAALGINVYIGNNAGTDTLAASDLATLKSHGIYAIVGQDSVGLASIDDPTIVGWWMTPDEPDNAQDDGMGGYGPPVAPATLVSRYNAYKAADPTRPVYLGLGQGVAFDAWEGRGSNAPPESQYVPAADVVAFDIYPYNNCGGDTNEKMTCGQFWLNALGVDRLHQWSNRGQAVWTDIETTTIAAGTSSGPTPAQVRSEVWLSLIHGANGVTYFVHSWEPTFREDGIFGSSTMVAAVTALNAEVKSFASVLNSADVPGVVSVVPSGTDAPIDVMVKADAKAQVLYVFAAIARSGTSTGMFTVAGMSGDATATVVGEGRTVDIVAGKWTDGFGANAVHLYELELAGVSCR